MRLWGCLYLIFGIVCFEAWAADLAIRNPKYAEDERDFQQGNFRIVTKAWMSSPNYLEVDSEGNLLRFQVLSGKYKQFWTHQIFYKDGTLLSENKHIEADWGRWVEYSAHGDKVVFNDHTMKLKFFHAINDRGDRRLVDLDADFGYRSHIFEGFNQTFVQSAFFSPDGRFFFFKFNEKMKAHSGVGVFDFKFKKFYNLNAKSRRPKTPACSDIF